MIKMFYSAFNKKHAIDRGRYIPETLGGKLFKFIRNYSASLSVAGVFAILCLFLYGTGIAAGQYFSRTYVNEYKIAVNVYSEDTKLPDEATKSRPVVAGMLELGLLRCKYRNERMFGLFDLFVTDKIYDLPNNIYLPPKK